MFQNKVKIHAAIFSIQWIRYVIYVSFKNEIVYAIKKERVVPLAEL